MSVRLLAISFAYPPASSPRAVQVARLLRHADLSTTLICASEGDKNDRIDQAMVNEAESFLEEIVRVPFVVSGARKLATRAADRFGLAIWEEVSDPFRVWKEAALRAAAIKFSATSPRPDVLITFGAPMSDHLIGLDLKRRFNVPWIAHFSDPWADNTFKKYNWLTRRINSRLEQEVIEGADRLLFTSAETIDLVMAKYPSALTEKASVLPHAFEPQSFAAPQSQNKIVIRFLGDMYGRRTPEPLFKALLEILNSEQAETLKDVRFEFVGGIYELNLNQMGLDRLPADLVGLRETVAYKESLELMSSAAGLLVIDAPATTSVFLPSKLIDYIGSARPILGITPLGTAATLITELGGWTANPTDGNAVKESLIKFVSFLRAKRSEPRQPWGREEIRKRFEASLVAKSFQTIVEELVSR